MNVTQENLKKVYHLVEHLHAEMKECESNEEFEICAELRDYIDRLGMYLTAYIGYEDVSALVYDLVKMRGNILILSTEYGNYYATFDAFGETWSFMVTKEEYKILRAIEDYQNEMRK
jgi:hypothetical protein